jgi:hypothetical protein
MSGTQGERQSSRLEVGWGTRGQRRPEAHG